MQLNNFREDIQVEVQLHLQVAIQGHPLLLVAIQGQLRLKVGIREALHHKEVIREALHHKEVILARHHQVVIQHPEVMVNSRR